MSKIKQSDLRVKLGPGESIRVSEGNGLTLIITGTQKGTSYKFQHRCTFDGVRIEKILKTKDLDEARQMAAERMLEINRGKHPDEIRSNENGLMFSVVADEWLKQNRYSSARTFHQISCYVERLKECFPNLISELSEKQIYSVIQSMQERHGTWTAKLTLSVLNRILRYSNIVYKVLIPDARSIQSLLKQGTTKHRPSLTDGNLDDNIIHIFLTLKEKTRQPVHIVMYYLAFLLLLRLKEINNIKVSDINLFDRVLQIEKTKTRGDGVKIPITDELEKVLNYLMQKSHNT